MAALEHIQQQLSFPLLGLHPDDGSEFLNWHLLRWCRQTGILLSRSRPEHKNDNCHVEQKNCTLVRRPIGYSGSTPRTRCSGWTRCTETSSAPTTTASSRS